MDQPTPQESTAKAIATLEPYVRSILARMVRTGSELDDVVQDVVVEALEHEGQLGSSSRLRPWLRRIARNKGIDWIRRHGHEAYLRVPVEQAEARSARDGDPLKEAVEKEIQVAFWRAVSALPNRDQQLVAMRAARVPYSVLAEVFGTPMGTLSSRVLRLMRALFDGLAKPGS